MATVDGMMRFEIATDLLRAQVVPKKLFDDWRKLIHQLSILVLIGAVFSMYYDLEGPVIGIQMTLGIGIPFEFATDRGGMPASDIGDVCLCVPVTAILPDVKSFLFT